MVVRALAGIAPLDSDAPASEANRRVRDDGGGEVPVDDHEDDHESHEADVRLESDDGGDHKLATFSVPSLGSSPASDIDVSTPSPPPTLKANSKLNVQAENEEERRRKQKKPVQPCPYDTASVPSWISFWWANGAVDVTCVEMARRDVAPAARVPHARLSAPVARRGRVRPPARRCHRQLVSGLQREPAGRAHVQVVRSAGAVVSSVLTACFRVGRTSSASFSAPGGQWSWRAPCTLLSTTAWPCSRLATSSAP